MADPIYFAPIRTPLVDTRNGLMAREWYLFFQALWLRTGGTQAPDTDDSPADTNQGLVADQVQISLDDSNQLNQSPLPQALDAQVEQLFVMLAGQQDQIAELVKDIQALRQGPVI